MLLVPQKQQGRHQDHLHGSSAELLKTLEGLAQGMCRIQPCTFFFATPGHPDIKLLLPWPTRRWINSTSSQRGAQAQKGRRCVTRPWCRLCCGQELLVQQRCASYPSMFDCFVSAVKSCKSCSYVWLCLVRRLSPSSPKQSRCSLRCGCAVEHRAVAQPLKAIIIYHYTIIQYYYSTILLYHCTF